MGIALDEALVYGRMGIVEVMNDKGGVEKEEVFRRSGFLVLFLFF